MAQTLPRLIAHRGASGYAPENTLAAFSEAAKMGAQWIELDANISSDGVPYVHHDDTINRCTDGSGFLLAKSSSELDKLDAGSWFSADFAGEPLPTLLATFDACRKLQLGLNIEIKPSAGWEEPTTVAICEAIQSHWPEELPLIVSSFSERSMHLASTLIPERARGFIVCAIPPNWKTLMQELSCTTLHCSGDLLDEQTANQIKDAGYGLLCWTVNSRSQAEQLLSWGVDSVFSDLPDKMAGL